MTKPDADSSLQRILGGSFWSGVLGATASCLGKLALDPDSLAVAWLTTAPNGVDNRGAYDLIVEYIIIRGVLFLSMLGCNALMLGAFLEGLEEQGSISGTSLATATNFVVSAAWGYFLWEESFPRLWWFGFGMILVGIFLLSGNRPNVVQNKKTA